MSTLKNDCRQDIFQPTKFQSSKTIPTLSASHFTMAVAMQTQPDGNHATAAISVGSTIQYNGAASPEQHPDDAHVNDNVENDTIGSGTADESSDGDDEEEDEFPPLIPGPGGIHVFIERDYRFTPRLVFPETMPSDLRHIEGLQLDQSRFEALIRKLNVIYAQTEHVGCMSVVETLIQMASCYTSLLCFRSQYNRYIDHADQIISHANAEWKRTGVPLFMLSPRERGMRCLELIAMPAAARGAAGPTATITVQAPHVNTNGRISAHNDAAAVAHQPFSNTNGRIPLSFSATNDGVHPASEPHSDFETNNHHSNAAASNRESVEMRRNGNGRAP